MPPHEEQCHGTMHSTTEQKTTPWPQEHCHRTPSHGKQSAMAQWMGLSFVSCYVNCGRWMQWLLGAVICGHSGIISMSSVFWWICATLSACGDITAAHPQRWALVSTARTSGSMTVVLVIVGVATPRGGAGCTVLKLVVPCKTHQLQQCLEMAQWCKWQVGDGEHG